ncbi:hypothetical protein QWZ08_07285 [Ferruginibacter paludis]|uniref:hypothetical protein n=1 Tax=Ferruginibacter paludis TaxID=1310417 RepID=UPI0025B4D1C5|nr:hypothetical protein [Ferruginibacter paludis]MDN3655421.1 hypothetical protein [Ferruginibacter paludis]
MPRVFFVVLFFLIVYRCAGQNGDSIAAEIRLINREVVNQTGGAVISNRAMNVFLADKTGYLAGSDVLSFFTNYVTFNSTDGIFTVNHNFQTPGGRDEPLKNLLSVGFNANVNSIGAGFLDRRFDDELGLTINYKWLAKVKTKSDAYQQQFMNALRAGLVHTLESAIEKETAGFNTALNRVAAADINGANVDSARALIQNNFYADLKEKYQALFATQQAELLTKTAYFKTINFGYTSFTATIPIIAPTYTVAPAIPAAFTQKHSYPIQLMLAHTRLWEGSHWGRLFVTLGGSLLLNNSKLSYGVAKINPAAYTNMGGTDTLTLAKKEKVYMGRYQTFITPAILGRIVYYPTNSHVGFSVMAEQHIGKDNLLNARVGVPIVLINSKKTPAVTFECYVAFFDMGHVVTNLQGRGKRTTVGIAAGIPFSRLMY